MVTILLQIQTVIFGLPKVKNKLLPIETEPPQIDTKLLQIETVLLQIESHY